MRVTNVPPLYRLIVTLQIILATSVVALGQSPSPTPDSRGLGVQSATPQTSSQTTQQPREAKPQLVLQTGYNKVFGSTRMVFSPDGRLLATAAQRSNSIKLWETATGRELRVLSTGAQSSSSLAPAIAFSRDSRLVAAAAGNNSVRVWDVTSGQEVQTLSGSEGSFASVLGTTFLGFGARDQLVAISDVIRTWDAKSGKELWKSQSSTLDARGILGDGGSAITPGGDQLAMLRTDPEPHVKFFDLSSGREVKTIKLPEKELETFDLSFAADGHLQVSAVVEKRLKVWDFTPQQNERDFGPTQKEYGLVKFSRDGRLLALSENYSIKVWEVASGKQISNLTAPTNVTFKADINAFVAFSDDSKRVATGGINTPTIIWEADTAKQLMKLSGRINIAGNVAFSADGNRLSSGGRTMWDLRTGRGLRVSTVVSDQILGLPSPDGKMLVLWGPNRGVIEVIETPGARKLHTLDTGLASVVAQHVHVNADSTILIVTYNPDYNSQPAPTGMPASIIKLWDLKTGRELNTLRPTEFAAEADLSRDGKTVVVIGQRGEIELWDAVSGNKLRDLKSVPSLTAGGTAVFNPGSIRPGQMPNIPMPNLSAISEMMTTMMGSMSAGTAGRSVTSLAFSPDGRVLATGGVESKSNFDAMMNTAMRQGGKPKKGQQPQTPDDFMKDFKIETSGQVQLWDTASGQLVLTIKGHGKGVSSVAFSRDGRILASASTDNTIKMWDAKTGTELRTLVGHTASIESMDFSPDARLFASAGEDGSTILWDAKTGEHLLTLISLDDGADWMVVTPQGLFDGTPVSWNQILWRYNQDTFNVAPIEWFFNEFYYPGLLSDVTAGKRPKVAQDVSKKDRRQPVVKLSLVETPGVTGASSRTVKVRIDVTDAPADAEHPKGSGARDLRLFRNGSLVKVWHGDVLKGQPSLSIEQEITVKAGPNRLVAYAFNSDNVKSKDAPLVFEGAESLKRKGTAYILAIGVNEYANNQYNLKYAVADAESFGEEVRRRQMQLGSIERVEVIPLLNQEATKANILSALKRLAGVTEAPTLKATPLDKIKRVEPEDTVIIYFAGHGTAQQQRFYLLPHDIGYTGDREKLTEEGLKAILSHSVSDLELEAAVEGLDANHLLMVIDACNSGQALEAEEKRRGPMNSKGLAQLAYEKGMYILTAAQSFQAALEAAQLGHGLLTYALVEEGLKTPVADNEPKDGVVNAREWLDFATLRVPQMQEAKMKDTRGVGIAFVQGEESVAEPEKKSVQRPRVFYRRELEANPLIVAKPQP